MKQNYPLSAEEEEAIQMLGGIDRVATIADRILAQFGFHRSLFTKTEREQIRRGPRPRKHAVEFHFDSNKSLRANIDELIHQARELQLSAGGTNYVGAMLQHLVGAKLDLILGEGKLQHHGFSVADHSTERKGDYQVEGVAIHVTTSPSEALVRKCGNNLKAGLRPVILSLGDGVDGAVFLLKSSGLADRVDVLDVGQFLTANVYEHSLFKTAECRVTLAKLIERYNSIVSNCETDPSLRIGLESQSG